jgi:hypothetical protein
LDAWASGRGISLSAEEPRVHDLDSVSEWISEGTCASQLTAGTADNLVTAWNLFQDVAFSVPRGREFLVFLESDSARRIYDKLFWIMDLPAVRELRPNGISIDLSAEECRELKRILKAGMELFNDVVRVVDR